MTKLLETTCGLMADKYGDTGRAAGETLRHWLSGAVPRAYPEILEKHLGPDHIALLFDAFWQVLPFGTGGRRGRVGYGANRLNEATVSMTVEGHCRYLRAQFPDRKDLSVVVANDVRVFNDAAGAYKFLGPNHPLLGASSRSLARLAAEIYAGHGIVAYLPNPTDLKGYLTTPELSFLIATMGAIGGINVSASHNPPDDNGVKIYDQYGSQPVAPQDQRLLDSMTGVTTVKMVAFDEGLAKGLIRPVPAEMHEKYLDAYVNLYGSFGNARPGVPIVYTPLCGCGAETVGDLLKRLDFPMLTPPAEAADGSFAVIPFRSPNPEVPQSTEPARAFADKHGSGIVLSSDPDADRVGLEGKLPDGTWYHFDGNQIGAILCYALMLDPKGPRKKGLVIETLVTTKLLGRIVRERGESDIIDDLLVGFKYVADVLKRLTNEGHYKNIKRRPEELVLAAEESHGVIVLPTIMDKDSAPACMFLAGLYQRLQAEGKTFLDYYIHILEELGGYETVNRSITMAGASGMIRKEQIMGALRKNPPRTIAGQPVRKFADYWDEKAFGPLVSESEKLPRNVLQVTCDRFVVTIRPSGTEPKLKFYCELVSDGKPPKTKGRALLAELRAEANALASTIYNELLASIDVSLGEAALLLPDIIELDRKRDFETDIAARLFDGLKSKKWNSLDAALTWLRTESSTLMPGADSLPALKAPIALLLERWAKDLPSGSLGPDLARWASGKEVRA